MHLAQYLKALIAIKLNLETSMLHTLNHFYPVRYIALGLAVVAVPLCVLALVIGGWSAQWVWGVQLPSTHP
jgi:hypothetical protein